MPSFLALYVFIHGDHPNFYMLLQIQKVIVSLGVMSCHVMSYRVISFVYVCGDVDVYVYGVRYVIHFYVRVMLMFMECHVIPGDV